jgi:elongation factor G
VIDYLPSPDEAKPITAHNPKTGDLVELKSDSDGPLCAYVFKVYTEEGRRLVYLRIYSGTLHVSDEVYNATRDKTEKIARLFRMHANQKERIEKAVPGDIVTTVGLKCAITGDTLTRAGSNFVLEPIEVSKPVISVAIEPKGVDASQKLAPSIEKLMIEDPTIKAHEDPDTGQIILAGMGELHLEISVDRLKDAFGLDINVGRPQVVYCVTVLSKAHSNMTFSKKIGEEDHYGKINLYLAPNKRGHGNMFDIQVEIPEEIKKSVLSGLEEACLADPSYGYEIVDVHVKVESIGSNDLTTQLGTKVASQMALQEAFKKANPVILEPIMELEVSTPEEYIGDVVGDLSARKASIEGITAKGKIHSILTHVALSKTFGYSTDLRSLTKGRGGFNMKFLGFDKV